MVDEYTLSIIPPRDVYNRLAEIISNLSGSYDAPMFEPHITLLGSIEATEKEMIDKTIQLASDTRPFNIKLTKVDYLEKYFRCLFIRAEETEPLMEFNNKAREMFGRQSDPDYMPHLSLLYGDYPPATKEEIIGRIGKEFDIEFEVDCIHIVYSGDKIPVSEWKAVKGIRLGSK